MRSQYQFTLARFSMAAIVTYQLILVLLIVLRPDLDPYWHTLSEWAVGPYGWLMSMAFVISGVSYFAMLLAILPQARGVLAHIGIVLLFICTLGAIGAGVFTTDPMDGSAHTTAGAIHAAAGFAQLMLFAFAAAAISIGIARGNSHWADVKRKVILVGIVPPMALAGFILHLSMFVLPLKVQYGPNVPLGWPARMLFLVYALWVLFMGSQLERHGRAAKYHHPTERS